MTAPQDPHTPNADPLAWLDQPDPSNKDDKNNDNNTNKPGLQFQCTMCGNCCSGPPGLVRFTQQEAQRIADHLEISIDDFADRYTQLTPLGPSLAEKPGPESNTHDCIFLDRTAIPGKAVCSIYQHRPSQCRTWPFWPRTLRSRNDWNWHARNICPGMNTGNHYTPQQIRVMIDPNDP